MVLIYIEGCSTRHQSHEDSSSIVHTSFSSSCVLCSAAAAFSSAICSSCMCTLLETISDLSREASVTRSNNRLTSFWDCNNSVCNTKYGRGEGSSRGSERGEGVKYTARWNGENERVEKVRMHGRSDECSEMGEESRQERE